MTLYKTFASIYETKKSSEKGGCIYKRVLFKLNADYTSHIYLIQPLQRIPLFCKGCINRHQI